MRPPNPPPSILKPMGLLANDGMRSLLTESDAHTWREPVPSAHDGSAASQLVISIHASGASRASRGGAVAPRVEQSG